MTDARSTPADLVTGLLGGTAERECERVVRLDPTDQQDVRAALAAVRAGKPWADDQECP